MTPERMLLGTFIGAMLGMLVLSVAIAAGDADRRAGLK